MRTFPHLPSSEYLENVLTKKCRAIIFGSLIITFVFWQSIVRKVFEKNSRGL